MFSLKPPYILFQNYLTMLMEENIFFIIWEGAYFGGQTGSPYTVCKSINILGWLSPINFFLSNVMSLLNLCQIFCHFGVSNHRDRREIELNSMNLGVENSAVFPNPCFALYLLLKDCSAFVYHVIESFLKHGPSFFQIFRSGICTLKLR